MSSRLVQATIQAAMLSATSNILAQSITAWRTETRFTLGTAPLFRFGFFTVLNTPPNFLWQQALEAWFPAHTTSTNSPSSSSEKTEKKGEGEKRLNLVNTFTKLCLDMTLGASVNTVVFVAGMVGLKGGTWDAAVDAVKRDYWPLMTAGAKLWPAVSLMNFAIVPVEKRVVVGSLVGVAWGVYLNLVADR